MTKKNVKVPSHTVILSKKRLKSRITALQIMKDRSWAQIKIILFQNELKGIEKLIQDKYNSQLQNSRKGERTKKGIEVKGKNHFRNKHKIRRTQVGKYNNALREKTKRRKLLKIKKKLRK